MEDPRQVTEPSAITMPTALIKPIPPNQTRMEPILRANAARGFMLHPTKVKTLQSHIVATTPGASEYRLGCWLERPID